MTRLLYAVLALRHTPAQRRHYAELRRVHTARPEPASAFALAHALRRWPA